MVKLDEDVKGKWGAVQAQYQRRTDLIPNLVATVKGAANFEKSTLTDVIEARAKATSVQVDPTKLGCLANWVRDNTMETVLIELRRFVATPYPPYWVSPDRLYRNMAQPANKKLPQPPEGSTYS